MTLAAVAARAGAAGLAILGTLHPGPEDAAPPGTGTLVLLGPEGAGFWPHFAAAPEALDGAPDPLDRWSRRVVGAIAADLGAGVIFPFEGPPWPPVARWATASGRAWPSPVGMLVHDRTGLWFSVRGILALPARLPLPPPPPRSPCADCPDQPCRTACPVSAFASGRYDPAACRGWAGGPGRAGCGNLGCAVRHSCPAGRGSAHRPDQAGFHMAAFLAGVRAVEPAADFVDKSVDKPDSG